MRAIGSYVFPEMINHHRHQKWVEQQNRKDEEKDSFRVDNFRRQRSRSRDKHFRRERSRSRDRREFRRDGSHSRDQREFRRDGSHCRDRMSRIDRSLSMGHRKENSKCSF
jgi:hypothetical protein